MARRVLRRRIGVRVGALMLFGLALPVASQVDRPVYVDREGRSLPIQEAGEILDFLRTARQTGSKVLSEGITKARRLDLEKGGLRMRAVFHSIDEIEPRIKTLPNGNRVAWVRDSYTGQVAAYRLGRMLGIPNIPPTVLRTSNGVLGSAQLWIEQAMKETDRVDRSEDPPDVGLWNQLYADMRVFDNLINNIDRNTGNMLIDSRGYLWLIDHTRSFGKDAGLPRPETITRCSRRLYEAVQNLDEQEVRRAMNPSAAPKGHRLLKPGEIAALFKRREKLLKLFEERIEEQEAIPFLFDYGEPDPGIVILEEAGSR